MLTQAAARSLVPERTGFVFTRGELARLGVTPAGVQAQCRARRWQVLGAAVVLHNGTLTRRQRWRVARINCGPRSMLAAFTAAEAHGLHGWERDAVHVLGPPGIRSIRVPELSVHLHRSSTVTGTPPYGFVQGVPGALILAASSFGTARVACGLLAAGVQQRLTDSGALARQLNASPRVRHRAAMLAAIADIGQGSHALSEIDFYRLCRRYHLPPPERQTVRVDSAGRRRYLDTTWRRPDGRTVVAEVDGALHLAVRQWWDDQERQNELSIGGALVLRFPSVIVRTDPAQVAGQLQRALNLDS